ncbi:MAG: hypothetical protein ABIS15_02535 [Gemmatimonadaceae bacterium]
MSIRSYCSVSAAVFAIVALTHVWRFALGLPMHIGAWSVPLSLSLVAAVISGALAFWAFRIARGTKPHETVYT